MPRSAVLAIVLAVLAVAAAGLAFLWARAPAALSFEVRDAASKSSVWDSTVRLQNRVIRGFYSTSYRFTHLRPGTFDLTVSAPHYEPASVRVRIRTGRTNTIAPISLVGYEIPDFSRLTVAAKRGARGLELQMTAVDTAGDLIKVFPCIDVRIAVRVSVQLKEALRPSLPARKAPNAEQGFSKEKWTGPGTLPQMPCIDMMLSFLAFPQMLARTSSWITSFSSRTPENLVPGGRRPSSELLQINDARALGVSLRPYMNKVKMESGSLWNIR